MKSIFNLHPYIELFASTIIIGLAIFVIARNPEDRLSRAFSFFAFIISGACFLEYAYRVTPADEGALMYLFHRLSVAFWTFGISAVLVFALVYAEKNKALRNPLTYIVIFLPATLISYMYLFTNMAVRGYITMPYGNASRTTVWVMPFVILSFVYQMISAYFIMSSSLRSKNPIILKRGSLIVFAIMLATLGGFITNAILPQVFKIRWFPPQAITGTCVFCLLTFIAIRRYSLFAITPDQAIDAILETTSGAIMAVDVGFKVSFANQSASTLLNSPSEEKIRGSSLKDFFHEKDYKLISNQLIMNEQAIQSHKARIKALNGEERLINLNGVLLRDKFGAKIGAILEFEDITEKEKAEKEQKYRLEELEKMNRFLVGREIEMVELKKEINGLLRQLGKPDKYTTA
jgi:PAS domain S-box-containing protein